MKDQVRVRLHDSVIKLLDHSFTVTMHLSVYDQLGAAAYTNTLYAWKMPSYDIHRPCNATVNTIALPFKF
jgi:hypothetical protein